MENQDSRHKNPYQAESNGLNIILIHGMGRTPLSMGMLYTRMRMAGFKPHLFGYAPSFETFGGCTTRLVAKIQQTIGNQPYAMIGHSLGTVVIRGALPALAIHPPLACFFLAPPSLACRAARFFAANPVYKLLMGEMGQLLADANFMTTLPKPVRNTWIYAGTKGLPSRLSPFGDTINDGVLIVDETRIGAEIPVIEIPATHTFIMNSRDVAEDIAKTLRELLGR